MSGLLFCFFVKFMAVALDNDSGFLVGDEADENAKIYCVPSNKLLRGDHDIALRCFMLCPWLRYLDQLFFVAAVFGPHKRGQHNLLDGATAPESRIYKAAPSSFELVLPESGHTRHADGGSAVLREILEECRLAVEVGVGGFLVDPRKINSERFHPIVAGEKLSES